MTSGLLARQQANLRRAALERLLVRNFFSLALFVALPRRQALRVLKLINATEDLGLNRKERKLFYALICHANRNKRVLLVNPLVTRVFA